MRASIGDITQTSLDFTGQRLDQTGLLYYGARYYDPVLARFVSPDSIVPGVAAGTGGVGAIGPADGTALRPLTVTFHEPGFVKGVAQENGVTLRQGFWFQLDERARKDAKAGWGPANPQALNRYSYVLNNPVRYTDPTGYYQLDLYFAVVDGTAGLGRHATIMVTEEETGTRYLYESTPEI